MKKNLIFRTNVFICSIIILGFIITSFISYNSNSGMYKRNVENVSSLTAEGIYYQIDSIFTKPIHISLTMANDNLLKDFLEDEDTRLDDDHFIEKMREYLFAYREQYHYDSVFLVSAETNRYYHFGGLDRVLTPDNPENDWYYAFLEAPEEYSINIDNDEATNNEITVFINCKIKNPDGTAAGIVGVGFRVDFLQDIFREYEEKFDIKAYLVDKYGNIQISTSQTGFQSENLFENASYRSCKEKILAERGAEQSFWYSYQGQRGYLETQYIKNLEWHLIIENDTTAWEGRVNRQLLVGIFVVSFVIIVILFTITSIIRKYNEQIVHMTLEKEKMHRAVFQKETEKMYENIYEVDITHNRAASEATENYFESLGVPKNVPYDKALRIIAEKQIKEEFREGYIHTFSPENVMDAFQKGKDKLSYDFMISKDQIPSYYWMRITTRLFFWEDDKSVRMFVYRQNIDEEKRHEKYLIEKMEQDSLTRLYNKAATQQHIQKALLQEPDGSFAFFILDIDDFKRINDTCGHTVGDSVITEFAQILKGQFRAGDIVGRIGGDEFVAFVPAPSVEWAKRKARGLVSALCRDFASDMKRCEVSASIGVALSPEAGTDFETLYRNADTALYQTKKGGKNGYTIF